MKNIKTVTELLNERKAEVDPVEEGFRAILERFEFDRGQYRDPGEVNLDEIKRQIIQFRNEHSGKVASAKDVAVAAEARWKTEVVDPLIKMVPSTCSNGAKISYLNNRRSGELVKSFAFKVDGDSWSETFTLYLPELDWFSVKSDDPAEKIAITIKNYNAGESTSSGGYISYGSSSQPLKSSGINRLLAVGKIAELVSSPSFDSWIINSYIPSAVDITEERKRGLAAANPTTQAEEANRLINSYVIASFARNVRTGTVLDNDAGTVKSGSRKDETGLTTNLEAEFGIRRGNSVVLKSIRVDGNMANKFVNVSFTVTYPVAGQSFKDPVTYEDRTFSEKVRIEYILAFYVNHSVQGNFIREDKDLEKIADRYY